MEHLEGCDNLSNVSYNILEGIKLLIKKKFHFPPKFLYYYFLGGKWDLFHIYIYMVDVSVVD